MGKKHYFTLWAGIYFMHLFYVMRIRMRLIRKNEMRKRKGLYGRMDEDEDGSWGESSLLSRDKSPLGFFVLAIYRFVSFMHIITLNV